MTDSTTDRVAPVTDRGEVPALSDESCVDFITGFPCTKFRCRGTLIRSAHAGQNAVVCSVCEHAYYVVEE